MASKYLRFSLRRPGCRSLTGLANAGELLWCYHNYVRQFSSVQQSGKEVQECADFLNGQKLILESGRLAKLADGSVVASLGNTSILVTAVGKARSGNSGSFVPLTVDYRQKYAAAGRIPTNYLRRELAPTEKEILTSRVVDRSVRPLFPLPFSFDVQLTCHLLAVDGQQEPDVVSINAASAALAVSTIPWNGPVGAVRVGLIRGEIVIFPTRRELSESSLNLVIVASDRDHIVMLEGSGTPVALHDLEKAIKLGVTECQKIVAAVKSLSSKIGQPKMECAEPVPVPEEVLSAVRSLTETRLREIFCNFTHNKLSRDNAVSELRADVLEKLKESLPETEPSYFYQAFATILKNVFRSLILEDNIRCDGRGLTDLRPISCSVDLFKPLHGSSLFQRGQTQVQCTVAFDAPDKALALDPLLEITGGIRDRNFFLHYSFPAYANNELSRGGPLSRREIGHGALASKGILPVIPKNLPYTVLLTSTVMESNGSSSMATVCGGSLALMDAGVEILTPVAGVAIGLVTRLNENNEIKDYKLLTDILGIEDYFGDMDFKVAGTKNGITAIQADIKLSGLPIKIVMDAIAQSHIAKKQILAIMNQVISKPNNEKKNLPVILTKDVPAHKRGVIMGPGGINIKKLQVETGVQISWQDNNTLSIFAANKESMDEAMQVIESYLVNEPELEFGAIYTAVINEIRPQGIMISLYDGMTPVLLHNSQLDVRKVQHPSALNLEVGQQVKVKYFGRDPTSGHMRLSRRALMASSLTASTKNLLIQNS